MVELTGSSLAVVAQNVKVLIANLVVHILLGSQVIRWLVVARQVLALAEDVSIFEVRTVNNALAYIIIVDYSG